MKLSELKFVGGDPVEFRLETGDLRIFRLPYDGSYYIYFYPARYGQFNRTAYRRLSPFEAQAILLHYLQGNTDEENHP